MFCGCDILVLDVVISINRKSCILVYVYSYMNGKSFLILFYFVFLSCDINVENVIYRLWLVIVMGVLNIFIYLNDLYKGDNFLVMYFYNEYMVIRDFKYLI